MNDENRCRVCRIRKKKNFVGYGFNLETKNEDRCQYIGIVDINSPASLSGLRGGDKIIEINNINIEFFNHDQIVKLIKEGLKINDKTFKDEVLLTVKSMNNENIQSKTNMRQFREPKFLKDLKFDQSLNPKRVAVRNDFKTAKSIENIVNKKSSPESHSIQMADDEPEVVIFI